MEIVENPFEGCFLIKNRPFADGRGIFFESYNQQKFAGLTGWKGQFVQDNQSESAFGVVRGMHFQQGEYAQAKLVRVLKGTVLDVILDLRPESKGFGKLFSVQMSAENHLQLFIPRGFAHGFSVLSPTATFFYKCDNYYHKPAECGIFPLDSKLAINWGLKEADIILSEKDRLAENWQDYLLRSGNGS